MGVCFYCDEVDYFSCAYGRWVFYRSELCKSVLQFLLSKYRTLVNLHLGGVVTVDIGENETHNMDNISDSVCGMKRLKRLLNEVQSQGVDIMQTEPPFSHTHKDAKKTRLSMCAARCFVLQSIGIL